MGEWYGRCLKESGLYDGVEVVVPLPLHPVKRCRRGYNQSEYIAEGIASQLGAEVDRRSVRRKHNTESQALKPRRERAATSTRLLRCAVPNGSKGGMYCWWTTSSRRAARCFVRRGDAARRTRMPDQHRGARRLAAGAGGEGVIGN